MDLIIKNRIKERIQELKAAGEKITIRQIASELEVCEDHVWRIIRGDRNPSQKLQFALAAILKCTVEELFFACDVGAQSMQIAPSKCAEQKGCDSHADSG